jgi:hypothetical protein
MSCFLAEAEGAAGWELAKSGVCSVTAVDEEEGDGPNKRLSSERVAGNSASGKLNSTTTERVIFTITTNTDPSGKFKKMMGFVLAYKHR